MTDLKRDMARIQKLVGDAFTHTGGLVALADGGQMQADRLQKVLEETAGTFESSTLELRKLCEEYSPGVGGFQRKPAAPVLETVGCVERFGYDWLHIQLNTLLPHCRYQTPTWLTDTLRRLLDDYESGGNGLPFFRKALLVIDEYSNIGGRRIFDQDNKGWKAISNAIKGRLIPDDDQYTLAVALLSAQSAETACHITLLEQADAGDFFSLRSSDYAVGDFYSGHWR